LTPSQSYATLKTPILTLCMIGEEAPMKILGMMLLLVGSAVLAVANPVLTPEIDPGAATTALALVSGAVLVIRGRRMK
jgi:hypothetical protein